MDTVSRLKERFYPNGYRSGTLAFYGWVNEYLSADTRLLNLGAGPPTNSLIRNLHGRVGYLAAADVDPVIMTNTEADQRLLIENGHIPAPDQDFDLVLSDFVLEHVEAPEQFLLEVFRVLKQGGCFFFRTPNRLHYVAIIARLLPHFTHGIANRARRLAVDAHEPWPTYYRLNAVGEIRHAAHQAGFSKFECRMFEAEPSYLVFNPATFMLGVAYERLVNRFEFLSRCRANIFGRLVK
ncbi:MAG: class I SAM-dependent methyltransferase [Candidatus Binataceae bacterium]|nr:class I SAM-dependent methyltransferase [Candidatus Binataceae bacterium]